MSSKVGLLVHWHAGHLVFVTFPNAWAAERARSGRLVLQILLYGRERNRVQAKVRRGSRPLSD